MHTHAHTHIDTCKHRYTHTHTHVHTDAYTHTCTHTYMHTHSQTHTHTHTVVCSHILIVLSKQYENHLAQCCQRFLALWAFEEITLEARGWTNRLDSND